MDMKPILLIACLASVQFTGFAAAPKPQSNAFYTATSYNQKGLTASGDYVHRHIVAADPDILPIGSRIKIKHAGRYSGEYFVADTGEKIQGRRLDLFIPDLRACRKFGRKRVRVQVLSVGDNTHQAAKEAAVEVKRDVKQDLAKKVVGNAATEDDWTTKKVAEANGAPSAVANEKAASVAAPKATPAAH
jgi:3D (Asp-Asp-Asp) domain-containing protein